VDAVKAPAVAIGELDGQLGLADAAHPLHGLGDEAGGPGGLGLGGRGEQGLEQLFQRLDAARKEAVSPEWETGAVGQEALRGFRRWRYLRPLNVGALSLAGSHQVGESAASCEAGDQVSRLGCLAPAWQIVVIHVQVRAKGAQFLVAEALAEYFA
jgi:hypothetical protein